MDVKELVLNGEVFLPDDTIICVSNRNWERNNPFTNGLKAKIKFIDKMGEHTTIGVVSLVGSIDGWHDLDGSLEENLGYYIKPIQLSTFFKPMKRREVRGVVSEPFMYKGQELLGSEFKLLHIDEENDLLLVEFDRDIAGWSADSMGKKGHCMLIPNQFTSNVGKEDKKKEPKGKENKSKK